MKETAARSYTLCILTNYHYGSQQASSTKSGVYLLRVPPNVSSCFETVRKDPVLFNNYQ